MKIATPLGSVGIRPETPTDEGFRLTLFAESRPDLAMLPAEVRATLVPVQFRAQTLGYKAQFPAAQHEIIELDGRPVGRIVCDRSAGALYLVDIALLAEVRSHGLGGAVMQALMHSAPAGGVRLRVANGNPAARRFYARLGFAVVEQHPADAVMAWPAPRE